ncbi:hypothetical protein AAEU29_19645 [Pseudoalteromonas sp. SSM20]|uniref:hypothetical protein n=1 Tax=Pseudoalteromonas sp. SSM20 TaxID=3139394 RepID=UPI003BA96402
MNKLIAVLFLMIFLFDVWFRIYPSDLADKRIDFYKENDPFVHLVPPSKPTFNKNLFGEVAKEKESLPKDVVAKKPKEPELELLAVFSTPSSYAFVSLKDSNQPAKKMHIGESYKGFQLKEINGTKALFVRANKQIELKVFKG